MSYFPKPYDNGKNKIKVELDLFSYTTKSDSRNATDIYTLQFAIMTDSHYYKLLLNFDILKLDIGKLEPTPADLSKLSNT